MNTVFSGKVWIITGKDRKLIDDIDTDMIFHNAHLAITDISEMGKYAFGNLEGWEDFPEKAEKNDIIFVGKNFGAGSSRQQAVDCFKSLGCSLIVAESFGAIYKRNAINAGFPILTLDSLPDRLDARQRCGPPHRQLHWLALQRVSDLLTRNLLDARPESQSDGLRLGAGRGSGQLRGGWR